MTREEQICSIARKKSINETCGAASKIAYEKGFEHGAKWADEHPKSPWISVEERLPEEDFNCIVTNKIAGGTSIAYYLKNDESWLEAYSGDEIHGITHWFPKPKFDEE